MRSSCFIRLFPIYYRLKLRKFLMLLKRLQNGSFLLEVVVTLRWYSVIDFTSTVGVNHVESLLVN